MVESALKQAELLEDIGHTAIVLSLKASDVLLTVDAYRLVADKCDYPLHVGITEAGTVWRGTIRSAVGIGVLLHEGIGDTIRVSLTGSPIEEVRVGYEILQALGLRQRGPVVISCPTCGRCQIDVAKLAQTVEAVSYTHLKQDDTGCYCWDCPLKTYLGRCASRETRCLGQQRDAGYSRLYRSACLLYTSRCV